MKNYTAKISLTLCEIFDLSVSSLKFIWHDIKVEEIRTPSLIILGNWSKKWSKFQEYLFTDQYINLNNK